ncbi:MAG TPA: OsmC family protein [Kofleriaceae bacterium]|nr:OsmC family protein [Kofleriaceae bacterium]
MSTAHLTSVGPPYEQSIRIGRHELVADEGPGLGGQDKGPAPYDYLMAGLIACSSITLQMYAARKGWELGTVGVDAKLTKNGDDERVERVVRLSPHVTEEQRARLAEIVEKTPVTKTLKRAMTIVTRFETSPS